VSAEPQTPLLGWFEQTIKATGLKQGRVLLEKDVRPFYPGLLMAYFFKELGMTVTGTLETGPFPDLNPLTGPAPAHLALASPWTLEEVVKKLLQYSNNFIANQVLRALRAHVHGPPATLDKGVQVLARTAAGLPGWEPQRLPKDRVSPGKTGSPPIYTKFLRLNSRRTSRAASSGVMAVVSMRSSGWRGVS
jgi:serine-type D-Ala-D-Ala carboxypeptidase/endopeptidase (penicillin-binding protein 4)